MASNPMLNEKLQNMKKRQASHKTNSNPCGAPTQKKMEKKQEERNWWSCQQNTKLSHFVAC